MKGSFKQRDQGEVAQLTRFPKKEERLGHEIFKTRINNFTKVTPLSSMKSHSSPMSYMPSITLKKGQLKTPKISLLMQSRM